MLTAQKSVRLLLAAALLGIGLVPAAHAADNRAIGWILTRVGSSARAIEGTLSASAVTNESSVVMFATTGRGAERKLDYRFTTTTAEWGGDAWVQINDSRVPAMTCVAVCPSPVGSRLTTYITSNSRALTSTAVYVTAYDVRDPTLTITSPGWRIRRWVPHWQDLSTGNAKGSTNVTVEHESAGIYRGGQLTGGRYGSFASALLPCDLYGTGGATFTGGTRSWPLSCDHVIAWADGSSKETTWKVSGEVTGEGSATGVLIVVDFPR
jgi:hypothetical protein